MLGQVKSHEVFQNQKIDFINFQFFLKIWIWLPYKIYICQLNIHQNVQKLLN